MNDNIETISYIVNEEHANMRLDKTLVALNDELSRSQIQTYSKR